MDLIAIIIALVLSVMALTTHRYKIFLRIILCIFTTPFLMLIVYPHLRIWNISEYTNENVVSFFTSRYFSTAICFTAFLYLVIYHLLSVIIMEIFDKRITIVLIKSFNKMNKKDRNNAVGWFLQGYISAIKYKDRYCFTSTTKTNVNDSINEDKFNIETYINGLLYPSLLNSIHLFIIGLMYYLIFDLPVLIITILLLLLVILFLFLIPFSKFYLTESEKIIQQ